MLPFVLQKNVIFACYFTGIYDVNRNEILDEKDISPINNWMQSLTLLGLQGVIFHNNLSKEICWANTSECINFVKIEIDENYGPNVFRYMVYNNFLNLYSHKINNFFVTDITDVAVLNNPFIQPLYIKNPDHLFCGDEPKILNNEWMKDHSTFLRSKINDYATYEEKYKNETLLNCGIVGGSITVMQPFIEKLSTIHKIYNANNNSTYTGDMGAFNYLVRTQYNEIVLHGNPINTVFKTYEADKKHCWFKHK